MIYRKTWFDYVLWMVYAGLCVMLLAYVGNRMYTVYVGVSLAKLGTFVLFPVLVCLYSGLRLSGMAVRKRHSFSAHFSAIMESLAVSVAFVFGTILRLRQSVVMAELYENSAVYLPGEYYEMALVRAGGPALPLAHGMSELFVRCLRLVFSFLGNSVAAAMLFQVVLQEIAMLLAFLAVRKAAGRLAAGTVLLLLAFSGTFINKIGVIDPECLLIALFLAGLYLVISLVKSLLREREGYGGLPGMFFLGACLGFLCYLDGVCVILFLFLAGLFTGKPATGGRKRQIGHLLIVIAGGAAGFCGGIAEAAASNGVVFYRGGIGWMEPYLHSTMSWNLMGVIGIEDPFYALLFLLASFVVFGFIQEGREQYFSLWLLPSILVTPAFFVNFSVAGLSGLPLVFWCIMAGLGLKCAVYGGQADLVKEKIEMINAAVPVSHAEPEPVVQKPVLASCASNDAVSTAAVPEDVSQTKPRYIENPLPLPKKHVKREMDYGYVVSEEDMHYDVEVDDGDDFDKVD